MDELSRAAGAVHASGLFGSFEALFLQFRWRRLFFWLFFLALVPAGFVLFEAQTNHFFLEGAERRVGLLRELNHLSSDGVATDASLGPIYRELVDQLRARPSGPGPYVLALREPASPAPEAVIKFATGAWLAPLGAFIALGLRRQGKPWQNTLLGSLLIGLPLGLVGVVVPTVGNVDERRRVPVCASARDSAAPQSGPPRARKRSRLTPADTHRHTG